MERQESATPGSCLLAERLGNRAGEVDLPVLFHQHLDRLYTPSILYRGPVDVHEFVCEVVDSMPQNLQSMSGLGSDDVRTIASFALEEFRCSFMQIGCL